MAIRIIPHTPSSNINSVSYDTDTMTLSITFRSGAVYQYMQVPEEVADGFSRALSATYYMGSAIVGQFPENRVF